jgi:iron complex transport system substrate-binding protein
MASIAVLTAALSASCSTDPSLSGSLDEDPVAAADSGQGATDEFPVTVSSCGREWTFNRAPSRVLLGYPRTLETLDALGVQDVAHGYLLGGYDDLPAGYPAEVVEVSPDYALSREALIGADPDLVLSNDEGQLGGDGGATYDDLTAAGSAAYVLGGYCADGPAPTSLEVVEQDVTNLGRIFGVPERAAELAADLDARVAAARESGNGQDLSVAYVQVFDGKLYAISGYPVSGILKELGLSNEFADIDQNFAEISTEEALSRTPDVLMVVHVGDQGEAQAVAGVKALLAGTPAVQQGRVYGADETDFQAGGVAIVDAVEAAATDIFGG